MQVDDFLCPRCGVSERPASSLAASRVRQSGRCQGCRALDSLSGRPWLLPLFVDFWQRTEFPVSDSWLRLLGAAGGEGVRSEPLETAGVWDVAG